MDNSHATRKIDWDNLDPQIYEQMIQKIVEVVEFKVSKLRKNLEDLKQERQFDLLNFWSSFKGTQKAFRGAAGNKKPNVKLPPGCKLNRIDFYPLVRKESSKLNINGLMKSKVMVSNYL